MTNLLSPLVFRQLVWLVGGSAGLDGWSVCHNFLKWSREVTFRRTFVYISPTGGWNRTKLVILILNKIITTVFLFLLRIYNLFSLFPSPFFYLYLNPPAFLFSTFISPLPFPSNLLFSIPPPRMPDQLSGYICQFLREYGKSLLNFHE